MVKDHSDSERGNPLPPHRLLLSIRFFLYAPSHRQDNTYHGLCYTSRGALAGTRNSSMGKLLKGCTPPNKMPWTTIIAFGAIIDIWNVSIMDKKNTNTPYL